jgi:stress response protein YsnF
VNLGTHNLALPATGAVLTRDDVRLPWPARRLAEARPLDAQAQDDAAAVGRAAATFEDPSKVALAEDPNAMTLSEERLDVRLEPTPIERVALRKTLVEETITVPVTVRREVVEVVREPVTDLPDGSGAAEVAEGVAADVVLYEERPVVGVEVVPRERVRLVKRFEVDEVVVADEVRHEEAAVDRLPPSA